MERTVEAAGEVRPSDDAVVISALVVTLGASVEWKADVVTPGVVVAGCAVVSAVVAVEVGDDVDSDAPAVVCVGEADVAGVVSSAVVGI